MRSSLLIIASFSIGHSLARAVAAPYDPWTDQVGISSTYDQTFETGFNSNSPSPQASEEPGLPAATAEAPAPIIATAPIITIPIPAAPPPTTPTCTFPKLESCCSGPGFTNCYDAGYTSQCANKPTVCCDWVNVVSRAGNGCVSPNLPPPAPAPARKPEQQKNMDPALPNPKDSTTDGAVPSYNMPW